MLRLLGKRAVRESRKAVRTREQSIRSVHQRAFGTAPSMTRQLRATLPAKVLTASIPVRASAASLCRALSTGLDEQSMADLAQKHGFKIVQDTVITERSQRAVLMTHELSGATLLSVSCKDDNKVFGISFKTLPTDSCGTPHILEHSVLCGSDRYPVKEPFTELLKGSLQTFLNAFTYPDRTCYPVASQNLTDFYNLIDVYTDAVFHPLAVKHPRTFQQEGWHHEFVNGDNGARKLQYKGVVFNEMKGVYSSPDSMHQRGVMRELYPTGSYSVDSGGDPREIPNLTFDMFREYHRTLYSPANALVYFYGDDNVEKRLSYLNERLSAANRAHGDLPYDPASNVVVLPKPFESPRVVKRSYAAGEGSGATTFASVSWLLHQVDTNDKQELLALEVLDHILLGTNSSPLSRALNGSGLGDSIVGGGLESDMQQPMFCVGLKGIKGEEAERQVEQIILKTLQDVVNNGIPQEAIVASMNRLEFDLRENNTGSYPRGLMTMLASVGEWVHQRDPVEILRFEEPVRILKEKLGLGSQERTSLLEDLIKKHFLQNKHRLTLRMDPSADEMKKVREEEEQRLARELREMGDQGTKAVEQTAQELLEHQMKHETEEELACIPFIRRNDLPKEVKKDIFSIESLGSRHTGFIEKDDCSGVCYIRHIVDIMNLPYKLMQYVPLYTALLTNLGNNKCSMEDIQRDILSNTGSFRVSTRFDMSLNPDGEVNDWSLQPNFRLFLTAKALEDKLHCLPQIVEKVMSQDFKEQGLLRETIRRARAGIESSFIEAGHSIAQGRIASVLHPIGAISECTREPAQLAMLRDLEASIDTEEGFENLRNRLSTLHYYVVESLLRSPSTIIAVNSDDKATQATTSTAVDMISAVGNAQFTASPLSSDSSSVQDTLSARTTSWSPKRLQEAIPIPSQVNYVGAGGTFTDEVREKGGVSRGSLSVLGKFLGTSYLWDEVRVKGGAYGGMCRLDAFTGLGVFLSYRDPNLKDTLRVYDGVPNFLRNTSFGDDTVERAVVGALGETIRPELPGSAAPLSRYLAGMTHERRNILRAEMLSTTSADFRRAAEVIEALKPYHTAVVGDEDAIRESGIDFNFNRAF